MRDRRKELPELPGLRDFVPKFYRGGPIRSYLPLLYDLIAVERPKRIVAIGFGEGEAFFTFCQAAREQQVECRCTAIYSDVSASEQDDAWQEGKAYGEEFYAEVVQFLAGSPVDLAKSWADEDVDLLLIDDCDQGSAISRDLSAWKSKLAPNALILLHGINLERKNSPKMAWAKFVSRRPHVDLGEGVGLGITLASISSVGKSSLRKRLFANGGELSEIYRSAAEKAGARARVAEIARQNAALETRQIWLDSVLSERWRAQEIMDHQARTLSDLEGRFHPLVRDREKAQEVMDSQAKELKQMAALRGDRGVIESLSEQLATLRDDRGKAQEVMDSQAEQLVTLRREQEETQLAMVAQAEDFEALRRDRTKAQLVMDAQSEQLKQFGTTTAELSSRLERLKAQVAEQKRVLKFAKEACRNKGRCFDEPRERRPIMERIVREVARGPRNLRKLWAPKAPVTPEKKPKAPTLSSEAQYQQWIANHEPDSAGLDRQRLAARSWIDSPKISLLVPVFNSSAQFLEEMLASVAAQTYQNWEISLVNASSRDQRTRDVLKRWAEREPRLRVQHLERNLGISENTNCALERATGDFIALLDQDDLLAPFALFELAQAIRANPQVDLFYSDEDRWNEAGQRTAPFFKPEWSPELLYSCMYLGHLSAYRRSLVIELGGFRKEFDLSQDYDLALRATERARAIYHIPHVLYHWREHRQSGSLGGKPEARKTNLAALADALRRRNLPADVLEYPTANRARMKVTRWPRVSLIIPTDSPVRLQQCLNNLPRRTDYPNWEIVIVTNSALANSPGHTRPANIEVRMVNYDQAFNFSAKSNLGAKAANGERLIFFNDDVEATQSDWIQNLIEPLENPEVGAVAPKMLYPTNKIQHAGLVTGVRGLVGTAFHQQPADTTMHSNFAQSMRDVSALSGACLALRREDFMRIGGFDEVNTPISHSDVDLCFKIRDSGMRCVYTPFVTMTHVGHVSIGDKEKREEAPSSPDKSSLYLLRRWGEHTSRDPYYPDNMRNWLFADSPTPIQMSGRNRFASSVESRNVLFVSHDLSSSGAPILLLHLVNWCKANGIFPVLVAPEGGALREKFEAAEITTIIDPLVATEHKSFRKLLRDFDCVVANTIKAWPAVRAAHRENVPVLWWLHETLVGDHLLQRDANLRASLPLADFILTPTKRTSAVYRSFTDRPVRHLRYGVPDVAVAVQGARMKNERPQFLLLGSMEPRKGQDILVEAVRQLPLELQSRAAFKIVGRMMVPEFAAKVGMAAKGLEHLFIENEASHAEALELIRRSDVLVCASRDEAMPVTIIEAMSLSKAVVSTRVGGISEVLKDGENSLLISPESAEELSVALARLITAPELVTALGRNARVTYEENFTPDCFGHAFKTVVEEVITNHSRLVTTTGRTGGLPAGAVA